MLKSWTQTENKHRPVPGTCCYQIKRCSSQQVKAGMQQSRSVFNQLYVGDKPPPPASLPWPGLAWLGPQCWCHPEGIPATKQMQCSHLWPLKPPTHGWISSVFTIQRDKRLRNVLGEVGCCWWVTGALNSPSLHRLSVLEGWRESKQSTVSCFQGSYLWEQMTGFYRFHFI